MADLETIKEQARMLNQEDRLKLVDFMLESLGCIDPAIEKLWVAESEVRYAAYKNGEEKAMDWADLRRELGR